MAAKSARPTASISALASPLRACRMRSERQKSKESPRFRCRAMRTFSSTVRCGAGKAGKTAEAHRLDQRPRLSVKGVQDALGAPEIEGIAALPLQGDAHVLEHGEVREHRRDLERAHEPAPGDVGGLQGRDV